MVTTRRISKQQGSSSSSLITLSRIGEEGFGGKAGGMVCQQCEEDQIVITHGTDTMSETAKVLAKKVKNKTIVLFGAMIPIKFGSSDGLFNLGSALAFVQTLPAGVYVAMNGRCFQWDNVRKNKQTGMFEEIR